MALQYRFIIIIPRLEFDAASSHYLQGLTHPLS